MQVDDKPDLKIEWTKFYVDQGCELHPSCLSCPREICKEDEPRAFQKTQKEQAAERERQRISTVEQYKRAGWPHNLAVKQAAQDCGCSVRMVYRSLERSGG